MSDSDSDNAYTDYLESRRAAVLKKKKPSKVVTDSDESDDELQLRGGPDAKKRRSEVVEEVEEEEDVVVVESATHDEHLKSKLDEMEQEYKRNLYGRGGSVIPCGNGQFNSVLTKAIKVCETLGKAPDDSEVSDEDEECVVEEERPAEESLGADMFPVTIQILDCEQSKESQRHEVDVSATFDDVRRAYASSWKCHINSVILTYNGDVVDADATPHSLGLRPLQIPYPRMEAYRKSDGEEAEVFTLEGTPDGITIKAQFKNRKKPIHLKLENETTLQQIKEMIIAQLLEEQEPEIPSIEEMKVMFDDEYLTELDATCQQIGLEDADCIDVYVK